MSALIQGSKEWKEMRRNYIGASDASAIMGDSPWTSPYELWMEKMGISEKEQTFVMQRGIELEEHARYAFEKLLDCFVLPQVIYHPNIPYMMASIDGLSIDGDIAVEIKCPGQIDHLCAVQGATPTKYIPQLMHQMEVLGLNEMYYFSYNPGYTKCPEKLLKVQRYPEPYMKVLLQKEKQFWECVVNKTPPPLSEKYQSKVISNVFQ